MYSMSVFQNTDAFLRTCKKKEKKMLMLSLCCLYMFVCFMHVLCRPTTCMLCPSDLSPSGAPKVTVAENHCEN